MMYNHVDTAALNANEILKNYGGLLNNDFIHISNLNADDNEQNTLSPKQSLYYDMDGIENFLKIQKIIFQFSR